MTVSYFDRPPYDKSYVCCCVEAGQPTLEVVDSGFMCCMQKFECCGKQVGLMPYETIPCFPLRLCAIKACDASNRVSGCDNLFGLCGQVTGKPKMFYPFFPQPLNADAFVIAAKPIMQSHFAK